MKFALFFLAEYANMIVASAVITTLYLGGWQFPYLQTFGLPPLVTSLIQILFFGMKIAFLIFFFIWVRWSLPRFRYDQLMNLGWKVMLPLSILNIIVTAIVVSLLK
jgi:NADH-quinone oxidoreductase subunit H